MSSERLDQIWADSERALGMLLAECRDFLSSDDLAQIEEFVAANEHECAYHHLVSALIEVGHECPKHLRPIQDRLELRFYGQQESSQ